MADSTTTNYALIKPEDHASDDTWGAKLNSNFDAIDTAIKAVADTIIQPDGVGDFFDTLRTLGVKWLRRDGATYESADYPDLAALLPPLPDGVAWTEPSIAESDIRAVIHDGTQFVLAALSGANSKIYTSPTGESWSLSATISSFNSVALAFGNGIYIAVDGNNGKASVSSNLTSWNTPIFAIGSGSDFCLDITFAEGIFATCGANGKISTTVDGVTWTSRTSGTSAALSGMDHVNGDFIAVGVGGVIATSPTGTTWTLQTSGTVEDLRSSAFGASTYVVVGTDGAIVSSTNLTAWTTRTSGTAQSLENVVYSSSGFLAVGHSGVALISSNGTSWAASATGASGTLLEATFDDAEPEKYVVAGTAEVLRGTRTLPTQFEVPDDNPEYGWIRALE